jgi:hypothetical protein
MDHTHIGVCPVWRAYKIVQHNFFGVGRRSCGLNIGGKNGPNRSGGCRVMRNYHFLLQNILRLLRSRCFLSASRNAQAQRAPEQKEGERSSPSDFGTTFAKSRLPGSHLETPSRLRNKDLLGSKLE